MKNLVCAFGLTLALGCTTAIVRPYVGEQQAWPTSSGSIVNTRYDLPVFTSLPPAPYEVIAELRIDSPLYAQPEEHHLSFLVNKAMHLGADALVFVDGQAYFSTTYGVRSPTADAGSMSKQASVTQVNHFYPESFRPGTSIIAIRWLNDPPPGLPARYARYSDKLLRNEPAATPAPAPSAPTTAAPMTAPPAAPAAPATPAPTHSAAPAAPALPAAAQAQPVTTPSPAASNDTSKILQPATPVAPAN
jgi:hypothetical protein